MVRQWLLGVVIFAALFAILVADFVPQAVRLAPAQVALEDMQAPKTIVNAACIGPRGSRRKRPRRPWRKLPRIRPP